MSRAAFGSANYCSIKLPYWRRLVRTTALFPVRRNWRASTRPGVSPAALSRAAIASGSFARRDDTGSSLVASADDDDGSVDLLVKLPRAASSGAEAVEPVTASGTVDRVVEDVVELVVADDVAGAEALGDVACIRPPTRAVTKLSTKISFTL